MCYCKDCKYRPKTIFTGSDCTDKKNGIKKVGPIGPTTLNVFCSYAGIECFADKYRSASKAAMQPVPAAVTA